MGVPCGHRTRAAQKVPLRSAPQAELETSPVTLGLVLCTPVSVPSLLSAGRAFLCKGMSPTSPFPHFLSSLVSGALHAGRGPTNSAFWEPVVSPKVKRGREKDK